MQTNLKGLETSYWKFQILKGTEKHKIIQFVQSTVRVKYMYLNQGNLSSFPTMSTLPLCLCSLPPHSFVFTTNTHTLAHLWHFNRMAIRHFSAFFIFDYTRGRPLEILFLSHARYYAFHFFVPPLLALLIFSLIFLWIFINSENGVSQ